MECRDDLLRRAITVLRRDAYRAENPRERDQQPILVADLVVYGLWLGFVFRKGLVVKNSLRNEYPAQHLNKVPVVADYVGVHENTVWSWIRTGKLPAVRIGERVVRVRQQDLDDFVNSHLSVPSKSWLNQGAGGKA